MPRAGDLLMAAVLGLLAAAAELPDVGARGVTAPVPVASLAAQLAVAAHLAAAAPGLIRIDVDEHRLPNAVTAPGIAVALAGAAVQGAAGSPPWAAVLGGAGAGAVLLALALVGGLGMGDAKLGLWIGLASPSAIIALLWLPAALLCGGLSATALLLRGGRGRRIAFGPFLLLGWGAALALAALSRYS